MSEPVIDSHVINLGDEDAALVFRQETKEIELIIPNGSKDDDTRASESVILASWFAYACNTQDKEVMKAVHTIQRCYDRDITKFLKESGIRK